MPDSAARTDSPVGIQRDLVDAFVPMLDAEARKGLGIRQRSCSVDSHHGFAAACCTRPLEGMRRGACHGGHTGGSHRETPRCWSTRRREHAVKNLGVDVASGYRVGWSGVGATKNVCGTGPPLPPRACARSAVVTAPGPPRYGDDSGDCAIARHCRRGRCRRRRTRPRSNSPRWRSCGCRRWTLGSALMCCRKTCECDLLFRDIRERRALSPTLKKRR